MTSLLQLRLLGFVVFGVLFASPPLADVAIVTPSPLPGGTINTLYTFPLSATGCGNSCDWSLVSGSALPPGLSLGTLTGMIGGNATAAGTFNFTIEAQGPGSKADQRSFSLTIAPAIFITTPLLAGASVNASYSETLNRIGGTAPYTWAITTGSLPSGVFLNSSTGAISGTPTAAGLFNFTVRVTDSATPNGATATQLLSILVSAPLAITTSSFPGGVTGSPYSQSIASTGGTAPYNWSLAAGTFPTGLGLNSSTGVISGTPTVSGTFGFTILGIDNFGATASKALSIAVALPLSIANSLPAGTASAPYSAAVAVAGGTAPFSWTIATGAIPAGLSLNSSSGIISGTPTPLAAGTTNFTVQVIDSGIPAQSVSQPLSIAIAPPLVLTTSFFAGGTFGIPYATAAASTGGTAPLTWSITSGALPAGLTLTAGTGVISGTPSSIGTAGFTIRVVDSVGAVASKPLTIAIAPAPVITTALLQGGTVSAAYAQTVLNTGGTSPLAWSLVSGALPTGLTLSGAAGVIGGTPSASGTFNFVIRVTDGVGATAMSENLSVTIAPALLVTTPPLPNSTVSATYSTTLIRTGGTAPFVWSIAAGLLPAGLTLVPGTGEISGTPTTAGTANFTAVVSDSVGATSSTPFSITVAPAPVITSTALTGGTVGLPYSRTVTSTGGTAPINWSLAAGLLPTGLSLNPDTGLIGGTASLAGTFNFTVRVSDSVGAFAVRPLSIVVAVTPTVTTSSLQGGTAAAAYSVPLGNVGGTAPFTWTLVSASGSLPTGLSLQADTGIISGTPSSAGTFNFTVRVIDSVGAAASQSLSIVIFPPLLLTTTSLSDGTSGLAYSATLNQTGGIAPYNWAITLGGLPGGLSLSSAAGTISGTPTATGTFNFTARVTDAAGAIASRAMSIAVAAPLSITTSVLPSGIAATAYSATLAATGGATPYKWSVTVGFLPIGLALNPSTGVISGTPASLGTEFFTVQVTDGGNPLRTMVQSLSITIVPAVSITTTAMQGGTVGLAYSQTLTATGGAPPYAWSITAGSLPPGLSLDEKSGLLSGTTTTQGVFNFTVRATDSVASTPASRSLSITVDLLSGGLPTLTVNNSSTLSGGTLGYEYSQSLIATGGILPHSFVVISGTLPSGLSLSTGGVLSGTPLVAGNFSFTVQVRDAASLAQTATKTLSITIVPALTIGTSALQDAVAAVPYSVALAAIGGAPPYRWSITNGSLPEGIVLDTTTGVISGTTIPAGTSNIRITLTDGQSFTASKIFSLAVLFPQIDSNLPTTVKSAQQPPFNPTLRSSLPNTVTGTLTLSFTPSAAVLNGLTDDPMLQFSNGLKTVNFSIPANSTTVVTSPPVILLTGTVAGTIRITANIQDGTATTLVGVTDIIPEAPQITALEAVQSSSVISIRTTGYSNTRSITSVTFSFDVRSTTGMQQVSLTRNVSGDFANWYQGSPSAAFGSSFVFVQSFSVQGNAALIDAVTVTLANAQGGTVSNRTVLTHQ